jgi:DNA-binding MarR family transcriptional regulator
MNTSDAVTTTPQAGTSCCTMRTSFTEKQGQYLAFIYYYTKVNGRPPAEADMRRYFRVAPPSVHQMVITLEANGFIERIPGKGRSISLLIPREQLPDLK